jgi:predicted dehydrogenase
MGKIRIGIVGAGGVSRLHVEGLRRHGDVVELVALCEADPQQLASTGQEYGAKTLHADVSEMIGAAQLDAAIVCTPTPVRRHVIEPLLRAGIPVLVEKPLAETYSEAAEIARIAGETGTLLAIDQNFRRHFGFALAREVIASGEIGQARQITHVTSYWRTDQGWRTTRSRYLMAIMSIHWFDGYRFMLDDEAESVYAQAVCESGGADVSVSVIIRMRKGTVISLSESFRPCENQNFCQLDGTAGGILLGYQNIAVLSADRARRREVTNPYDKPEATFLPLSDLLAARASRRKPETCVEDNLGSMRILEAAYRSVEQGRAILTEEIP